MADIANVNAVWFIYQRYWKILGLPLNKQNALAEFTAEIVQSLIHVHKTQADRDKKGRPKRKDIDVHKC